MFGFHDARSTLVVCGECGQNTRASDRTGRVHFHRNGAEECPGSGAQVFPPAPAPEALPREPGPERHRGSSHYTVNGFRGRGR